MYEIIISTLSNPNTWIAVTSVLAAFHSGRKANQAGTKADSANSDIKLLELAHKQLTKMLDEAQQERSHLISQICRLQEQSKSDASKIELLEGQVKTLEEGLALAVPELEFKNLEIIRLETQVKKLEEKLSAERARNHELKSKIRRLNW